MAINQEKYENEGKKIEENIRKNPGIIPPQVEVKFLELPEEKSDAIKLQQGIREKHEKAQEELRKNLKDPNLLNHPDPNKRPKDYVTNETTGEITLNPILLPLHRYPNSTLGFGKIKNAQEIENDITERVSRLNIRF